MPTVRVNDATAHDSLEVAFMRMPRSHRVALILSTYLLAFSIAIWSHVIYANAGARKPSVYVAAGGQGDLGSVQLLSIPASDDASE